MNKIYIIGNGFDLHHKLLSRYSHFYDYLKNDRNSIEIIRTFDCFINLSNDKWSNFEEDIALLNEKSFIDYYKDELLIDINSEKMDFFDRD